jgi:hypothetical protein
MLFCITLSIGTLGGLVDARWSVYGDHELRSYYVYTGHSTPGFTNIPDLLMQTEIGYPGKTTRYRPTNYLMYIAEGILWGNHPQWMHIARIASLAFFLCMLALGFLRWFPPLLSAGLCAAVLTASYWKHVMIGFSANEQYILLIAPFFVWSYVRIYPSVTSPSPQRYYEFSLWLLCCISAMLLAGVKENMLVVLFPLLWLSWLTWRANRRFNYRLILLGASCAFIIFIAAAVVIGVHNLGTDFYGNSVEFGSRLHKLALLLKSLPILAMLLSLVAFTTAALWGSQPSFRWVPKLSSPTTRQLALFQAILLLLSFAHGFFYGSWPVNSRYAFPGDFFVFLTAVLWLYAAQKIMKVWRPQWENRAANGFGLLLLVGSLLTGYADLRKAVNSFTTASNQFSSTLDQIMMVAKSHPSIPIVVESATPYDLEPVFSINRFLLSYGVTNPLYLRVHSLRLASFPDNAFFHGMIRTLEHLSETGEISTQDSTGTLPGPFLAQFRPISELKGEQPCFSIELSVAPSEKCRSIGKIMY